MAHTYREREAYQLSAELRTLVLKLIVTPPACNDRRFCDQIRDAARSAPRNVAEGFGRYGATEFAQFLDIAVGSLDELDNHLRDGAEQNYFSVSKVAEAIRLCARSRWAIIGLRSYLRREAKKEKGRKRGPA